MASAVVNGIPYDWSGIEIDANNKIVQGAVSISYDHEVLVEILMAAGKNPFGRTDGVYKPGQPELELYESSYTELIVALGAGYMMKKFQVSVAYAHPGDPTRTDELIDCRIVKDAHSHKQGPNGVTCKVTLSMMRAKINGIDPVNT